MTTLANARPPPLSYPSRHWWLVTEEIDTHGLNFPILGEISSMSLVFRLLALYHFRPSVLFPYPLYPMTLRACA